MQKLFNILEEKQTLSLHIPGSRQGTEAIYTLTGNDWMALKILT